MPGATNPLSFVLVTNCFLPHRADLQRHCCKISGSMARATKVEKARHLNAVRGLLQSQLARADVVRQLAREFDLSQRQAYRYLEKASQL